MTGIVTVFAFPILYLALSFAAAASSAVDEFVPWRGEPREQVRELVQEQQAFLLETVPLVRGESLFRSKVEDMERIPAFHIDGIYWVDGRSKDGSVAFHLSRPFSVPLEGSSMLIYDPGDAVHERYARFCKSMPLLSQTEDTWHWEGGGLGGSGHTIVHRIAGNWFYVETYIPM